MDNNQKLIHILLQSHLFQELFHRWDEIHIKNFYVAGGSLTQTVWNYLTNRPPEYGLKDIDIIYYDPAMTRESEIHAQTEVSKLFECFDLEIDVQNEASVHKWYFQKFGYGIEPYKSIEDALFTWLPAFAVAVQKSGPTFNICAPFGLDDLFAQTVRPNNKQINQEIYMKMVTRVKKNWPETSIEDWK